MAHPPALITAKQGPDGRLFLTLRSGGQVFFEAVLHPDAGLLIDRMHGNRGRLHRYQATDLGLCADCHLSQAHAVHDLTLLHK